MFKDPRDYQILFLLLFLVLGISTRDWTIKPELVITLILTCLITQWLASYIMTQLDHNNKIQPSFRSPIITSLGLSLLLRAQHPLTMILAGCLAIISKFIFRIEKKHFFNPANFGIITVLSLTNDAWVSPGQWGEDWFYGLLFLGTGGIILKQVGRLDTTVTFLGCYAMLEAARNIWLGWTWDVFAHRLTSGSLLLFALFMITDPRSIPDSRSGRLIWATSIAILTYILRNYFYLSTAIFWALFLIAPTTILIDLIWSAPRFNWKKITS